MTGIVAFEPRKLSTNGPATLPRAPPLVHRVPGAPARASRMNEAPLPHKGIPRGPQVPGRRGFRARGRGHRRAPRPEKFEPLPGVYSPRREPCNLWPRTQCTGGSTVTNPGLRGGRRGPSAPEQPRATPGPPPSPREERALESFGGEWRPEGAAAAAGRGRWRLVAPERRDWGGLGWERRRRERAGRREGPTRPVTSAGSGREQSLPGLGDVPRGSTARRPPQTPGRGFSPALPSPTACPPAPPPAPWGGSVPTRQPLPHRGLGRQARPSPDQVQTQPPGGREKTYISAQFFTLKPPHPHLTPPQAQGGGGKPKRCPLGPNPAPSSFSTDSERNEGEQGPYTDTQSHTPHSKVAGGEGEGRTRATLKIGRGNGNPNH
ncbi:basic salivary proline-rich protein 3-like [Mus pahari]|uniref:basic salivary proline-rich protein 3-like n=1 Tax=Mus pahari TaxID=10093 RepID=UPI000A309004|nr:basic salivary proline-rich protein 3-like [Mus pahari]